MSTRRVRFADELHPAFDRGVHQIVEAIRPTLGPIPRTVAIERPARSMPPELLDSGATIARRVTGLPDRTADVGAMHLRGLLWRLQDDLGDGTATAAVLFSAILQSGRRAIAAGVPAQPLREHLVRVADLARQELARQRCGQVTPQRLLSIAESACQDAEIAALLADIHDVIGANGRLDLRPSNRRESWREFVEGVYFETGSLTTTLLPESANQQAVLINPAIIISDLAIAEPAELVPAIEAAHQAGAGSLLIIARSLSPAAMALLYANHRPGMMPIMAVKTPGLAADDQRNNLDDLAVMTGGRPFIEAAGDRLHAFSSEHAGSARRAWATRQQFGIINGQGDPLLVRQRIVELEAAHDRADRAEERARLLTRLGVYVGGSSTLWLGASGDAERSFRQHAAERGSRVLRHALRDGVVPGGGVALLACRPALQSRLDASQDPIERAALRIVSDALAEPIRTLLTNAGLEAPPVIAEIERSGCTTAFDTKRGTLVTGEDGELVDAFGVVDTVFRSAVSSAALALTIDAVIHARNRAISVNPE